MSESIVRYVLSLSFAGTVLQKDEFAKQIQGYAAQLAQQLGFALPALDICEDVLCDPSGSRPDASTRERAPAASQAEARAGQGERTRMSFDRGVLY